MVNRKKLEYLFLLFCCFTRTLAEDCTSPLGNPGRCVIIRECNKLSKILYDMNKDPENLKLLRDSFCGQEKKQPKVCCDDNTALTTDTFDSSILPTKCGMNGELDKILGGLETGIKGYPWMALIEFRRKATGKIITPCAGSLITKRYVLSAAHCFTAGRQQLDEVKNVRLGEYDTSNPNPDCEILSDKTIECNDELVVIPIEDIISHPLYSQKNNIYDIALIRLQKEVSFTNFIKPICLPTKDIEIVDEIYFHIAGWGKTKNPHKNDNPKKLFVSVPYVEQIKCNIVFNKTLLDSHICAGGETEKDSCTGDSGGPLMYIDDDGHFQIAGIVSYGAPICGKKDFPAVYTKVYAFIDWIHKTIVP